MAEPRTILCIASYEKGHEFMRQCKRSGWKVLLLTSQSLKDKAHWPTESHDDALLPRQARDARQGEDGGREHPRVRPRPERRGRPLLHRARAGAVGAQA